MQTFNEIKGELRKLHENRAILRKEEEKRFSDVRNIFQGDSLKETFAPYGVEVKTRHEYLCNYVYVIINNSQEILLFVCNDDFKNLKIKYLDDEGKFNKDYFFNYLRYTLNSYSYESFKESAALVEIYLKNVEKVLKESKICDVFNKYQDCLDKLNNVNKEIREKENLAEKAWILEKYGASRYDIQVGKSYYLYDSRLKFHIAYVEVLSEDESGLGYKCVDHEDDDKKYVHVRPNRLEVDMRGYPKDELACLDIDPVVPLW